uniref:Ig-like domain-containing protein n=1 Tax=Lates calcarifer TaxID=8187 RepID=A0A4W6FT43_LATCA
IQLEDRLLLTCSSPSFVFLQSGDQVSHPGATVMMECSMGPGFSMGSYTMYWYRQNHHGAPVEFLTKEYDQTVGRFQSSLDTAKNNFSLQITELHPNDSSTYYCAASHSDENRPDIHTNNKETRL